MILLLLLLVLLVLIYIYSMHDYTEEPRARNDSSGFYTTTEQQRQMNAKRSKQGSVFSVKALGFHKPYNPKPKPVRSPRALVL